MRWLTGDLRYALRGLLARPLFALVAIGSLALGIGVNTAIFSLFQQVVLQPLPVHAPERLVNLGAPGIKTGSTSNNNAGLRDDIFSYPMFRDLQAAELPFDGIAAHRYLQVNAAFGQQTRAGIGMLVSGNYFALLGLSPALGRLIGEHDDAAPGAGRVAVLGHRYWRNELGGRADVLGQSIVVNGVPLEIIGVAPAGFDGTTFGTRAELFIPITQRWTVDPNQPPDHDNRQSYWVYLFGRLAGGVAIERAEAAINQRYAAIINEVELPLHGQLDAARLAEFRAKRVVLSPGAQGQSSTLRDARQPLGLLLAVAGLVLLIACLNLANLQLVRGAGRAAEMAVRASIGASRGRLLRQLLLEASLLAALGAVASVPVASLALRLLLALLPPEVGATGLQATLDPSALGFTLFAAALSAVLFGLFPALQLARIAPIAVLRADSGIGGGARGNRFRHGLAVAQIALSMASLALAGLLTQSLANLRAVDLGMQVDSIATFAVSPVRSGYTPERAAVLFDRIEEELAGVPGVTSVATSMVPILSNSEWGSNVTVEGYDSVSSDATHTYFNRIGDGFFGALGIPLIAGRDFQRSDMPGSAPVAIVNRRFADTFGLGNEAIGKRIRLGSGEPDTEIVGVVADAKYSTLKADTYEVLYLPRRQSSTLGTMNFYVRSALAPEHLLPQLSAVVARLDPQLPVVDLRTLPQQIEQTIVMERFAGTLSAGFALLATLLAALGLYGILSYTLSQRMREIGLRLALGAEPARLARMVFGQVGRMTAIGGVFGIGAALLLGRAAESLLFGLDGHDPAVLAAAAVLLSLIALLSAVPPARRAARTDPMTALRHE